MDDEGRPNRLWSRLLFQPREHSAIEWRLGLVLIGAALFGLWLIVWTFIPGWIANVLLGIGTLISWGVGLFAGGGGSSDVATPALTTVPTTLPSPSPSPSPSPFPR